LKHAVPVLTDAHMLQTFGAQLGYGMGSSLPKKAFVTKIGGVWATEAPQKYQLFMTFAVL